MKNYSLAILLAAGLIIPSMTVDAEAVSIRVKCEKRGDRSRVSVDAKDLTPGVYSAEILSESDSPIDSHKESDDTQTISPGEDQVEFDFDSNPKDIAAGATAIDSDFIVDDDDDGNYLITGHIIKNPGGIQDSATVACRVR